MMVRVMVIIGIIRERKNLWEDANNHRSQPVVGVQRRTSSRRWVLGQQQNAQVSVRERVFCRRSR